MNQSHKISEKLLIPYDIWFYVTFSNSALKKKRSVVILPNAKRRKNIYSDVA